ncbi:MULTISPECIES: hypothetical protein [Streptomyces]|uniref:Uncharacterized protein n=2 Tax=Streptomyces TaxID=1883 RepID=A0ABV9J2S9_9ACTN
MTARRTSPASPRGQALACVEALAFLRDRYAGSETAIAVSLGTTREAVDALADRLTTENGEACPELRLTMGELHTLHSALTAAATRFLSHGGFLQEPFRIRLGYFRENFDALARDLADAVKVTS